MELSDNKTFRFSVLVKCLVLAKNYAETLNICFQKSVSERIAATFILIILSSHLLGPINERAFLQCLPEACRQLLSSVCVGMFDSARLKKIVKFI